VEPALDVVLLLEAVVAHRRRPVNPALPPLRLLPDRAVRDAAEVLS
jgi:hypothetical protein